jgi:glycosyltransferase involved in cell wall biosynthesis
MGLTTSKHREALAMNVLALASYPIEAAATRYRLAQFVGPLRECGIEVSVRPFLDSQLFASLYDRKHLPGTAMGLLKAALKRLADATAARKSDVLLLQREAVLFGPPLIEWLATKLARCPMVLDLDDATYVPYTSPSFGRVARTLKWFSKTDDLIRWSKIVTCGNRAIAEYVSSKGVLARIIPTVVDTDRFRPKEHSDTDDLPVLGWVGTHSTLPYLESIVPTLEQLARSHRFRLKVVGSGRPCVSIPGVEVENLHWRLEREVEDFRSFDIGLYPIDAQLYANRWAAGKSGFKAIQYMAVGIPYVATPVGASAEIGEVGVTHFCASTSEEWANSLETLLNDPERRRTMGAAGRRHAIEHYNLPAQTKKLAQALRDAAESS